ncbi:MAG: polysaccharide deacetylase family protein [Steroidobacteraceae bacterium]
MTRRRPFAASLAELKDLVLSCLYFSGVLWGLALLRLRQRIVVLTYHRVLPRERQADSYSAAGILVTPSVFDMQMRFLRRHFTPLSWDEFLRILRERAPVPRRACLVTFDDGWHDTLEFALPVLRRHAIPAVLFIAGDFIGTGRCFWQERMSCLLDALRDRPETARLVGAEPLANRDSIREFVTRLKAAPMARVDSLLSSLERMSSSDRGCGEDRFLDWNGVSELVASRLVTIGSHAMSHRPLTRIPPSEASRELRDSRHLLRHRTGTEITALAYPNGDATRDVAGIAEAAGFHAAFTTVRGHVTASSDPFLLSRLNIHEGSARTRGGFLSRMLGLT